MKQTLKYILATLNDNLRFAEAKHSVVIALNSAIIVFISGFLSGHNKIVTLLSCLVIISCSISMVFNFTALLSRKIRYIKNVKFKENELNLIYYKHIINFSYDQYLNEVKKQYNFPKDYKFDGLDNDLAKQIIAISNVTNLKFTFFNYSLIFLLIGVFLTIVDIILVGLKLW